MGPQPMEDNWIVTIQQAWHDLVAARRSNLWHWMTLAITTAWAWRSW
jgi:hypothetical protein